MTSDLQTGARAVARAGGFVLFAAVACPSSPQAANFEIADGDVEGLYVAVAEANLDGDPDTITLALNGDYLVTGNPDQPETATAIVISSEIVINGRGAIIRSNGAGWRFMEVTSDGMLHLNDLTIRDFGADSSTFTLNGAAAFNSGFLSINRCSLISNTAPAAPFTDSRGGGISNAGTLQVVNSTFSGNKTRHGGLSASGGAIWNFGSATIISSTISNNRAVSIAPQGIGQVDGAGIYNIGDLTITNSIVADNMLEFKDAEFSGNCNVNSGIESGGFNLDDDGTCELDAEGDLKGVDPLLLPLANNGGLTPTHALDAGSPAINAGKGNGTKDCPPIDQRGWFRNGRCDIGAFEKDGLFRDIESTNTASWFYLPQDGHGFNLEILANGLLLAYWYTYDPDGFQRWLFGVGTVVGNRADVPLTTTEGMRFGEFDPETNEKSFWGTITFFFKNCLDGYAAWTSSTEGYASGGIPLERITNVADLDCNPDVIE